MAEDPGVEQIHPDRVYKVPWLAEFLGMHPDTVYRMIGAGKIRKISLGPRGGRTAVLGRDVIAFLEGGRNDGVS